MILCPKCQHKNLEGVFFCEDCGFKLWNDGQEAIPTNELANDSDEFSVKSGWGTSTFKENNHVVIHIGKEIEEYTIRPNEEFLIGRSHSASNIQLDLTDYDGHDQGVSRLHASLHLEDDALHIVDIESANGTFINGQRITSHQPYLLRNSDQIKLGSLVMYIYFT